MTAFNFHFSTKFRRYMNVFTEIYYGPWPSGFSLSCIVLFRRLCWVAPASGIGVFAVPWCLPAHLPTLIFLWSAFLLLNHVISALDLLVQQANHPPIAPQQLEQGGLQKQAADCFWFVWYCKWLVSICFLIFFMFWWYFWLGSTHFTLCCNFASPIIVIT